MKQGRASSSSVGSTKVNPTSKAVNPGAVSQIGIKQGNHAEDRTIRVRSEPLYEGRGLKAPMKGTTIYPKGSQR